MPPPLLPRKRKVPSPSPTTTSSPLPVEDNDYRPSTSTTGRRGAAVSIGRNVNGRTMSKEQLRKQNHSQIERRRREKINSAFDELRGMVPGLGEDGGKGGEFKLEVLERTVIHMRGLIARIEVLEERTGNAAVTEEAKKDPVKLDLSKQTSEIISSIDMPNTSTASSTSSTRSVAALTRRARSVKSSITPPSPHTTPTPDPNETEAESDLPPPFTFASSHLPSYAHQPTYSRQHCSTNAHSPQTPSITSLLSSANGSRQLPQPTRPEASTQATNPTLYLPFPTPSPTSPFLSYHPYGAAPSTAGSSLTGPLEPSPFIAPLQNISLFGGILNLNLDAPRMEREREWETKGKNEKDINVEEAAELLLAFSSPDVMRPVGLGVGGVMPRGEGERGDCEGTERRQTTSLGSEGSEAFLLDGGHGITGEDPVRFEGRRDGLEKIISKTARDILRM